MAQLLHTSLPAGRAFRGVATPVCPTLGAPVRCRGSGPVLPSQTPKTPVAGASIRYGRVVVRAYEQGSTGPSRDPSLDGVELQMTVTVSFGSESQLFDLYDDKLHVPTVLRHFVIADAVGLSLLLDERVQAWDPAKGFTYAKYPAGSHLVVRSRHDAAAGPGPSSAAAGTGLGGLAAEGGPDTSAVYIRQVLFNQKPFDVTDVGPLNEEFGPLDRPLGAKLPLLASVAQAALASSIEIQQYVVAEPLDELTANAHQLRLITTMAVTGVVQNQCGGSEIMNVIKIGQLVDMPLLLAAASLGLDFRIDRNTTDQAGATGQYLRPDFLFWVSNVLLFKGEDEANTADLESAVAELKEKMATPWIPALLPGVSMPCMFAYAAAGSVMQFFAITSPTGAVEVEPISGRLDISTPLGRIRVVHYTLKILQALATYAPHAPRIPIALGGVYNVEGLGGKFVRSLAMFKDFVRKRVDLSQQPSGVMDYEDFVDMYNAIGRMQCPNLVRLQGSNIHLQDNDTTLVLHLEPVGLPLFGPPENEADLKQAVRDVLTGLAALHAAGFVHRDIRWPNVIKLPAASQSSPTSSQGTYVLIDLEHAAHADCDKDCRQPELQLRSWPDLNILDPRTGRYMKESDLCLLATELMGHLRFVLSDSGDQLRQNLATRQVTSAEAALQHAWLAPT